MSAAVYILPETSFLNHAANATIYRGIYRTSGRRTDMAIVSMQYQSNGRRGAHAFRVCSLRRINSSHQLNKQLTTTN